MLRRCPDWQVTCWSCHGQFLAKSHPCQFNKEIPYPLELVFYTRCPHRWDILSVGSDLRTCLVVDHPEGTRMIS